MKRRRERADVLRAAASSALVALALLILAGACGSTSNPVGAGAQCFLATDCDPGLACVPQAKGGSICSDDLSRVAGKAPPEGGAGNGNGEGGRDGSREGGDSSTGNPSPESGTPDTGGGGSADTGSD